MTVIRSCTAADASAVHEVVTSAFGRPDEADLGAALMQSRKDVLSLVAVEGEEVVGYILFTAVTIESEGRSHSALGLAPLAVRPQHQRRGIGSRLVQAGLEACRAAGHDLVVVLGHPNYYPRFGFVRASAHGFRCEFDAPDEAFLVTELRPGAAAGVHGVVRYASEFHGSRQPPPASVSPR